MADLSYHEKEKQQATIKLRELQKQLPAFLVTYFRGVEYVNAPRTRIAYAIDLKTFFEYLHENNPACKNIDIHDFPFSILTQIKSFDIEEYLEYLKYYEKDGKTYTNDERAIKRKLSALRSMYNYYHKNRMIDENPVLQVSMPKLHDKAIVRLEPNEVVELLDTAESGQGMTKKQLQCHEQLKIRDVAILTLLLGTGIRISECIGLDIKDVDFDNSRIKIVRKGGYEAYVYFGDEVEKALQEYMVERKGKTPVKGHENALFLSNRNSRITVRSVEILVKKYAGIATPLKKITPHKLRSTYGTSLYRETGDIYLVADVLGHHDVNTTKKHYAAIEEERRMMARNKVKLRED
ncbi:MAG: tyrosine-type recombinase/integrase [Butyrivibrio sp.]